jgi:hypothetical protein
MKSLLKAIVLIPVVLAGVGFALANREPASISFDLFEQGVLPYQTAPLPLWAILLVAMAFGVVLGGGAVWWSQRRHRRAASRERAVARDLRREVEALRAAPSSTSVALR